MYDMRIRKGARKNEQRIILQSLKSRLADSPERKLNMQDYTRESADKYIADLEEEISRLKSENERLESDAQYFREHLRFLSTR